MNDQLWHTIPAEETLQTLDSGAESGLSSEQIERRRAEYGPNELQSEPPPTFWERLFAQFNNFIVWLLIVAALISGVLGEWAEAIAIAIIVILNAILGVVQEGRAEESLEALKKLASPEADVTRDGHRTTIPASELVPGDIVHLEAGNYVPADLRLLTTFNLKIEEASLTGESVPVEKDANATFDEDKVVSERRNMAYMGTTITYGRGEGIVTGTGMRTEIGKIAEMIQETEQEDTPLQRSLDQVGKALGIACIIISGIVFVTGLVRANAMGIPFGTAALDSFLVAVALAIAAVPEGLPAIVTINLAIGMQEMAKRNALIRRLPAVETLGSASVICSDKTGTLTMNQMTAVNLYVSGVHVDISGEGYSPEGSITSRSPDVDPVDYPDIRRLLMGAMLASDAKLEPNGADTEYEMIGDPTEGAMVVAAAKANIWRDRIEAQYPRVQEIPFDSERKRMTTFHHNSDGRGYVAFTKGAPDVVLELSDTILENGEVRSLTQAERDHILNVNRDFAQQALRVLAVAQRKFDDIPEDLSPENVEDDLTFIGLIAMIDPARPEVKPAIEEAREAGIRTMMITGDYADTAAAIAEEIGLKREDSRVVTGAELERMSDEELVNDIDNIDVFARVNPSHKVRIVEAFRTRDQVVAMTGDGVNDAPALKRASIGVAMGITGTDVSKEAADMILTDDNYVSIVNAVEQGRVIYANIRKFIYFLISCNLAEIAVIFIATLVGWTSPLTPIQLLWLNLLSDGAPALALGMEKGEPDIMDRPPRSPKEPIINGDMIIGMIVQTFIMTLVTLGAFVIGRDIIGPRIAEQVMQDQGFTTQAQMVEYVKENYGEEAGLEIIVAQTMAFATLTLSELLRAYTARSEYFSIFKIGVFSNKYMQYAVVASFVLFLGVVYLPFLQPIFNTTTIILEEWLYIVPLVILPSIAAEVTKVLLRSRLEARRAEAVQAA